MTRTATGIVFDCDGEPVEVPIELVTALLFDMRVRDAVRKLLADGPAVPARTGGLHLANGEAMK